MKELLLFCCNNSTEDRKDHGICPLGSNWCTWRPLKCLEVLHTSGGKNQSQCLGKGIQNQMELKNKCLVVIPPIKDIKPSMEETKLCFSNIFKNISCFRVFRAYYFYSNLRLLEVKEFS
jgi:hypothetical protein